MSHPLAAAARALLPPAAALAGGPVAEWQRPPLGPEAAVIARAVPARRAEFVAGRAAARAALVALGLSPVAIPRGPAGAPLWPDGIVGSISHAAGLCLAAAAREVDCAALGLDIEEDRPLPADLVAEVCGPAERASLPPGDAGGRAALAVFSAKEAAYKALHPRGAGVFGFDALEVTLHPGGFAARLARPLGPFPAGFVLRGRRAQASGLILSLAVLPPGSAARCASPQHSVSAP